MVLFYLGVVVLAILIGFFLKLRKNRANNDKGGLMPNFQSPTLSSKKRLLLAITIYTGFWAALIVAAKLKLFHTNEGFGWMIFIFGVSGWVASFFAMLTAVFNANNKQDKESSRFFMNIAMVNFFLLFISIFLLLFL